MKKAGKPAPLKRQMQIALKLIATQRELIAILETKIGSESRNLQIAVEVIARQKKQIRDLRKLLVAASQSPKPNPPTAKEKCMDRRIEKVCPPYFASLLRRLRAAQKKGSNL